MDMYLKCAALPSLPSSSCTRPDAQPARSPNISSFADSGYRKPRNRLSAEGCN